MHSKQTLRVLLALSGAALAYAPAMAQTAPKAKSATIEEVVVTAQRQETRAQNTAISMSVYTASAIQSAGVHDISSLTKVDPSVQLSTTNGAAYVAMRGIASTDLTEIGDPSVPVARDGFFTNRSYSLFSSLYDVARIEVLKGPQGTLFGRQSTGGMVNIISQRPTRSYGGYASIDAGNYNALNVDGAINLPLSDKVQLRVSAVSRYHDGYRTNTPATLKGDDENVRSVRAQLAFQPFDGFDGLISYQRDSMRGVGDVPAHGPYGLPIVPNSKTYPVPTQAMGNLDDTRYRAEFSYSKLPFGTTLTYLGGLDKVDWHHRLDATNFPNGAPLAQFVQSEQPETQNHEVRLASPTENRLAWQAGYFYFNENNGTLNSGLQHQSGAFAGRYLINFLYAVKTTSSAFFGQANYKLTDQIKLTVGARSTRDEKTRTGNAILDLAVATGGFLNFIVVTPGNGHIVETKNTYHLGLDYQITPRNLLYVKYDTGYKPGGFNSNGRGPSVPYGPETVTAYEIGSKNRFFDQALQANLTLFSQDYSGYQASQFTPALGGGPGIQNAGAAKIYGAEGEMIALVPTLGRLSVNATWLHARFTTFNAINNTGTATVSLGGNALPVAPDFSMTAALEHAWHVGDGTLTGRIDGKYQTKMYYSFYNFIDTQQKAYSMTNASLTWAPGDGKWELQGYIRNLSDAVVFANVTRFDVGTFNEYEFQSPRTIGAKLTVHW
jgi:iron complex outermembrane receptor protein